MKFPLWGPRPLAYVLSGAWLSAGILVYAMLAGSGRNDAYWVQLVFEEWPEDRQLTFTAGGEVADRETWLDDRATTPLAISHVTGALVIKRLEVDGVEIPMSTLRRLDRWAIDEEESLIITEPGGLVLPGAVSELTFHVGAGDGRASVDTYAGQVEVAAGAEERTLQINCAPQPTCWIFGVAGSGKTLQLQMSAESAAGLLQAAWLGFDGAAGLLPVVESARTSEADSAVVSWDWNRPDSEPRPPSSVRRAVVALLVTLLPVLLLGWLLRRNPWMAEPTAVRVPFPGRFMARVLFAGLLVFHLLWALTMPIVPTNDSVEYYAMARQLAAGAGLEALNTHRTPGYPLLIAGTLRLFGDNLLGVVLLQHAAVVGLAVLVFRLVGARHPRAAIYAAAFVGFAPLTTLCSNAIWTETFYTVATCAVVVIYVFGSRTVAQFVVIGVLLGTATLIRPTGWWLGLCIIGAELVRFAQMIRVPFAAIQRLALMAVAAALFIVPWMLFFLAREGSMGLSKAQGMTFWANSILQARANDPAASYNAPLRLLFAVPYSSVYGGRDPFLVRLLAEEQGLPMNDRFFMSVFRTAETLPGRMLSDRVATMAYNLTFRRDSVPAVMMLFPELDWLVSLARLQSGNSAQLSRSNLPFPELHSLTTARLPNARGLLTGFSNYVEYIGIIGWPILIGIAVLKLCFNVFVRRCSEWLVPLAWIAFGFAGPLVIGMPAQRYVMVIEPILLLCCGVFVGDLLKLREKTPAT